jgi:hypothetical protein
MTRRKKKSPPFVMLPKEMIRSKAWQKLKHYSIRAYIEIALKYNGSNKDNLSFTYREASRIMHRNTYGKAITQLVEHGLIDVVRSGGLFNRCNIFGLSKRWRHYGTENFVKGKRTVIDPKWKP